jgi:hypothetical protein
MVFGAVLNNEYCLRFTHRKDINMLRIQDQHLEHELYLLARQKGFDYLDKSSPDSENVELIMRRLVVF